MALTNMNAGTHAANGCQNLGQISFKAGSIMALPCSQKAKIISAERYVPQPKKPSRRDQWRADVATRKLAAAL